MTYAIVETGGKQLRVEPGRFYDIERLPVEAEEQVTLDQVLFVNNDGEALVGQPLVAGATVTGTVVSHLRGRKVIVYKMKPKKKTRKKRGHRQELTRLMIDSIQLNGQAIAGAAKATESPGTAKVKSEAAPAVVEAPEPEVVAVVAEPETVAPPSQEKSTKASKPKSAAPPVDEATSTTTPAAPTEADN